MSFIGRWIFHAGQCIWGHGFILCVVFVTEHQYLYIYEQSPFNNTLLKTDESYITHFQTSLHVFTFISHIFEGKWTCVNKLFYLELLWSQIQTVIFFHLERSVCMIWEWKWITNCTSWMKTFMECCIQSSVQRTCWQIFICILMLNISAIGCFGQQHKV